MTSSEPLIWRLRRLPRPLHGLLRRFALAAVVRHEARVESQPVPARCLWLTLVKATA